MLHLYIILNGQIGVETAGPGFCLGARGSDQVWRVRTRGKRVSEMPQNLGGEVAEGSG